ncbi:isocitrate lyase/phosphoenolpyruvate mutase family protein, partial [Rhizobium ruizarguesonis]
VQRGTHVLKALSLGAKAVGLGRYYLFLAESDLSKHAGLVDEAIESGRAYAAAGGSGFFVPGLIDPALIEKICAASPLPVN